MTSLFIAALILALIACRTEDEYVGPVIVTTLIGFVFLVGIVEILKRFASILFPAINWS